MSQKLGIKFTDYGQIYHFSSGPFVVEKGAVVIVKTEQGMGLGEVVSVSGDEETHDEDLSTIYRLANESDLESRAENLALARDAFRYCRTCITSHKLDMKLVDVEVFFDRSKMIFYFTAPGRIDFRELIKDLVREYRTRIELRQIGVRHETQMLGAIGNCGQMCCCRRFMRKFVPVTIKMAKEQNLFLNPTKISGICGRLLCCLSFEQQGYEEFNKKCPKVGKRYRTSEGMAKVIRVNFFRKTLTAIFEDGSDREILVDEWEDFMNKAPSEAPALDGSDGEKANESRGGGRGDSRQRPSGGRRDKPRKPRKPRDGKPRDSKPAADSPKAERPDPKQHSDTSDEAQSKAKKSRENKPRDNRPDTEAGSNDGPQSSSRPEGTGEKRRPRRRRRRPRKKPQS